MDKKIDVTSTAIEKGLDMAKGFLDKLIMPAIEEVGLLAKDQVTLWRFNQQIKMLNKSKRYCDKHNIDPKTISLKLLCPLLEYSGLEEDDKMQDKWAILLGNMVDSEQNIENHVFPYILSQISWTEYNVIDLAYRNRQLRINKLMAELNQFAANKVNIQSDLRKKIKEIDVQITQKQDYTFYSERLTLGELKRAAERELSNTNYKESSIKYKINEPEKISDEDVKEFEISNLIRLGVVKEVRDAYVRSQTLEIPNEKDESHLSVDLDIDVETNDSFILTELGVLFLQACSEKTIR